MSATRTESDTFGPIDVAADRYWGAQAQRSLGNFKIGWETQPLPIVRALGVVKRACAEANMELGRLDDGRQSHRHRRPGSDRRQARQPLSAGRLADRLRHAIEHERQRGDLQPRYRTARRRDGQQGAGPSERSRQHEPVVERHLSDGDAHRLCGGDQQEPAAGLRKLRNAINDKAQAWADIIKIGRTHTQDATPLTLGQEFSGYTQQLDNGIARIESTLPALMELAQGGTAVGTGLNAPIGFAEKVAERVSAITGLAFTTAPNKFEALAAHDAMVFSHGAINTVAASLFKIANDIRFLGSGPRSGLGELALPENEPGSSIMPGKVNPTQCEALTQVCVQIFGNHAALSFAGSQGHFELNVFNPVMAYNFLQSVRLMSDAAISFTDNCVVGIEPRADNIKAGLERSLMLVTALAPKIGYDNAAKIAKTAHANGTTLKQEAVGGGYVTEAEFDEIVRPEKMISPS